MKTSKLAVKRHDWGLLGDSAICGSYRGLSVEHWLAVRPRVQGSYCARLGVQQPGLTQTSASEKVPSKLALLLFVTWPSTPHGCPCRSWRRSVHRHWTAGGHAPGPIAGATISHIRPPRHPGWILLARPCESMPSDLASPFKKLFAASSFHHPPKSSTCSRHRLVHRGQPQSRTAYGTRLPPHQRPSRSSLLLSVAVSLLVPPTIDESDSSNRQNLKTRSSISRASYGRRGYGRKCFEDHAGHVGPLASHSKTRS